MIGHGAPALVEQVGTGWNPRRCLLVRGGALLKLGLPLQVLPQVELMQQAKLLSLRKRDIDVSGV